MINKNDKQFPYTIDLSGLIETTLLFKRREESISLLFMLLILLLFNVCSIDLIGTTFVYCKLFF